MQRHDRRAVREEEQEHTIQGYLIVERGQLLGGDGASGLQGGVVLAESGLSRRKAATGSFCESELSGQSAAAGRILKSGLLFEGVPL